MQHTKKDESMPLVTVIIPIYNVEKYIKQCVNSVINQKYRNIEIILINDGSTDNSGEICDSLSCLDDRIKVIHKKNGGVSSARNMGIEEAKGEYVSFVDADDWLEDDMIDTLISTFKQHEVDIVMCGNNWIAETSEKVKEVYSVYETDVTDIIEGDDLYYKFFLKSSQPWDKMWKRSVIGDIRFSEEIAYGEDMRFLLDVMINVRRVAFVPERKYNYRYIREGNVCSSNIDERSLDFIRAAIEAYYILRLRKPSIGVKMISRTIASIYQKIPVDKVYFFKKGEYDAFVKECTKALRIPIKKDVKAYVNDEKLQKIYKDFLIRNRIFPKLWFLREKMKKRS